MNLLWCKIHRNTLQIPHNLVNEGFVLAWLMSNEVAFALSSDFNESVASHVLDTYVPVSACSIGFAALPYLHESHA